MAQRVDSDHLRVGKPLLEREGALSETAAEVDDPPVRAIRHAGRREQPMEFGAVVGAEHHHARAPCLYTRALCTDGQTPPGWRWKSQLVYHAGSCSVLSSRPSEGKPAPAPSSSEATMSSTARIAVVGDRARARRRMDSWLRNARTERPDQLPVPIGRCRQTRPKCQERHDGLRRRAPDRAGTPTRGAKSTKSSRARSAIIGSRFWVHWRSLVPLIGTETIVSRR